MFESAYSNCEGVAIPFCANNSFGNNLGHSNFAPLLDTCVPMATSAASQGLLASQSALQDSSERSVSPFGFSTCVGGTNGVQYRQQSELQRFYNEKVQLRKSQICKSVREVVSVVQEILKEVEQQEPRFISTLVETHGRFEGLRVLTPNEFEVCLYLNQMGVFNFLDDGTIPGCAVLKLSDGRKRSMSLWVEFITASGYLSARKIRSRFQALVSTACEKLSQRDNVKVCNEANSSEVRLVLRDRYLVHLVPAFRCPAMWPRSAAQWPLMQIPWPSPLLVQEVKAEGFTLQSKDSPYAKERQQQQQAAEGDAWVLSFEEAEFRLLQGGCRRKLHSILKALRDAQLDSVQEQPVGSYHMKTLVLNECEKHPYDSEWEEACLPDRLHGVLMELIYRLQNRRFPHFFLANLDLFAGKSPVALKHAAMLTWRLLRELQTSPHSLLNPP